MSSSQHLLQPVKSSPSSEKLQAAQNGSITKWWFTVRGNDSNIKLLEEEWHNISLQTDWKLEPVYQYENTTSATINEDASFQIQQLHRIIPISFVNAYRNNCEL